MSGQKSNIKEAKTLVIRNKIKDSQGFRPGSRAMVKTSCLVRSQIVKGLRPWSWVMAKQDKG